MAYLPRHDSNEEGLARISAQRALFNLLVGNYQGAAETLRHCAIVFRRHEAHYELFYVTLRLAEALRCQGQASRAQELLVKLSGASQVPGPLAQAHLALCEAELDRGSGRQGRQWLRTGHSTLYRH